MISSLPFCPSPRQLSWVYRDEEGRQWRGVVHSLACSATGGHPYSSYNHHSFTFWFSSIRSLFLWDHESDGKGQQLHLFGGDRAFYCFLLHAPFSCLFRLILFLPFKVEEDGERKERMWCSVAQLVELCLWKRRPKQNFSFHHTPTRTHITQPSAARSEVNSFAERHLKHLTPRHPAH